MTIHVEEQKRAAEYIANHPELEWRLKNPDRRRDETDIEALGGTFDDGVGKIRYETREDAMRALAECKKAKCKGSGRRSEKRVYYEDGGWYLTSHAAKKRNTLKKYKFSGQHNAYLKKETGNKKRTIYRKPR